MLLDVLWHVMLLESTEHVRQSCLSKITHVLTAVHSCLSGNIVLHETRSILIHAGLCKALPHMVSLQPRNDDTGKFTVEPPTRLKFGPILKDCSNLRKLDLR